jgi:hypothetical protein
MVDLGDLLWKRAREPGHAHLGGPGRFLMGKMGVLRPDSVVFLKFFTIKMVVFTSVILANATIPMLTLFNLRQPKKHLRTPFSICEPH